VRIVLYYPNYIYGELDSGSSEQGFNYGVMTVTRVVHIATTRVKPANEAGYLHLYKSLLPRPPLLNLITDLASSNTDLSMYISLFSTDSQVLGNEQWRYTKLCPIVVVAQFCCREWTAESGSGRISICVSAIGFDFIFLVGPCGGRILIVW
jgi:hypothetical protein